MTVDIYCPDKRHRGKRPKFDNAIRSDFAEMKQDSPELGQQLYANIDDEHSDVTLICAGKTFKAHKFILSSRSDVFKAMFGMRESVEAKTGQVEIKNLEPQVLKLLLEFIYTDRLGESDLKSYGQDLFEAADRYNIRRLAVVVEEFLSLNVSTENVCALLHLAHLHEAVILEKMATNYLLRNVAAVKKTDGWKELRAVNAELLVNVLAE